MATVERELEAGFFWSMTMATGRLSMLPTCGRPYLGRYCCTNEGNVSFSSLRDLAAMVSSTSEDLPEPDTPVKTVILYFGIRSETCCRLFSYASLIVMCSLSVIYLISK